MTGVPPAFRQQKDRLAYEFNTGTAKHLFCSVCGIKAFHVPRSHPDGYSMNARCLDAGTVQGMQVKQMDGVNWEQSHPTGGSL